MTHFFPTPTLTNRTHLAISKVGRLLVLLMTCGVATDCRMVFADDPRAVIRGVMEALQPSPAPDYVEMINAPLRGTANAENNFFAALFPMVALEELDESQGLWVDRLCKEIGCVHPDQQSIKFRSPSLKLIPDATDEEWLVKQCHFASTNRWDEWHDRHVDRWLNVNQKSLDLLFQATERTQAYRPLIPPEGKGALVAFLPDISLARKMARAGSARVMRSLSRRDLRAARNDLISLNRLASHIGQANCLVQLQFAYDIRMMIQPAQAMYLSMPRVSGKERKAYLKEVDSLRPVQEIASTFMGSARLSLLDEIEDFRLGIMTPEKAISERTIIDDIYSFLVRLMIHSYVDWIDVRRGMEIEFEICSQSTMLDNIKERVASQADFLTYIRGIGNPYGIESVTIRDTLLDLVREASQIEDRRLRGLRIGQLLACLLMPDIREVQAAADADACRREITRALPTIIDYVDRVGEWPRTTNTLTYGSEGDEPVDPYGGVDFRIIARENTVTIYSLGLDGVDQSGLYQPHALVPSDDVGIEFPRVHRGWFLTDPRNYGGMPSEDIRMLWIVAGLILVMIGLIAFLVIYRWRRIRLQGKHGSSALSKVALNGSNSS